MMINCLPLWQLPMVNLDLSSWERKYNEWENEAWEKQNRYISQECLKESIDVTLKSENNQKEKRKRK